MSLLIIYSKLGDFWESVEMKEDLSGVLFLRTRKPILVDLEIS